MVDGVKVNEMPWLTKNDNSLLCNGYVVTLDLHMLHSEHGAVKLEDTILITEHGSEIITKSSRELHEVRP